ncbi:hypothetical protein K501DRAFT_188403, partial [Backusella circina FSU 941]
ELSSVTKDKLLLQAAIDRQTIRSLRNEQSTTRKKKKTISKKEKYFQNLAKNQVTDISISIPGSHIDGLAKVWVKRLHKKKNAPAYENNNINALSTKFKKIVNSGNLKVALNSCENYKPTTPVEHVVNRIYLFVLRAYVERPWLFSSENLKQYSEFDLQVKFWGYIFESYLGQHRHIILHWGDTMSNTCKNVGLRFKLDLRCHECTCYDETVVDGATGEIARKATKAKLYADRLKSVLTTKCHLNAFLKSLRYISEEDIINVHMPIVQVMELEAKVSSLCLIGKKKYAMEDLHSFKFPRTSEQLKSGELESLINSITLIEEMVNSLETKFNDGQTENESSMDRILKEGKKKKEIIMEEWLSDDVESKKDSDEERENDSDNQEINDEITNNDSDED